MASQKADSGFQEASRPERSAPKQVDWFSVVPRRVDSEDALGDESNARAWEKLYREAKLSSAGEEERRAMRAAVYVYCAKNGTSREGDYTGSMVLSNGTTVSSAVIARAAGRHHIRKFLRANMIESYQFFKASRVMESDERFVAKCAALGIAADFAFATSDWLTDCPLFTPSEARAHELTFVRSIDRARRARGGKTLETVEGERIGANLEAQGPSGAGSDVVGF